MIETKDLFAKSDLIPVIIQDRATKDILMLGYTNQEAYQKTLETHTAWFWSRSRQKLWNKGETSGHFLYVKKMITDCDTPLPHRPPELLLQRHLDGSPDSERPARAVRGGGGSQDT